MALDFNEIDLINIKANKFDKLEHIFETLDNETETEILPSEVRSEKYNFIEPLKYNSITGIFSHA